METKRRQILIDKPFQVNIILHSLFLATLCLIVFFALDFSIFNKLDSLINTHLGKDELQKQILIQKLSQLRLKSFLLLSASTLAVTSVSLLYISHRVAGPIYRTKLWLQGVDKSEALKFRKGDFFKELASEINIFSKK
jgi:hypothetical protein